MGLIKVLIFSKMDVNTVTETEMWVLELAVFIFQLHFAETQVNDYIFLNRNIYIQSEKILKSVSFWQHSRYND